MSQTTQTQTEERGPFDLEHSGLTIDELLALEGAIEALGEKIAESGPHMTAFHRKHQRRLCQMFFQRSSTVDIGEYPLGEA